MEQPRVLVVEDDNLVRMMIEERLRQAGCSVTSVISGEAAVELLERECFDLLLTDLHLQGVDGIHVMAAARTIDPEIAVIVLTGKASVETACKAIDHGVYSYLLKPARADEVARITGAALARRQSRLQKELEPPRFSTASRPLAAASLPICPVTTNTSEEARITIGKLELNTRSHLVSYAARPIPLSEGEFQLLVYLALRCDTVTSAQQLARDVLKYPCTAEEARDLVKARIHRLRQKLQVCTDGPQLLSVRGVGYKLAAGTKPD